MLPTVENKKIIDNSIAEFINANCIIDKKIIIFGCTLYAPEIIKSLKMHKVVVDAFIDNDKAKDGSLCSGILVHRPDYIVGLQKDLVLVIIASPNYAHEMQGQIKQLGFDDNNILNIPVVNPQTVVNPMSIDNVRKSISTVENGVECYESLMRDESDTLLLFPYPGTGDVYIACGFLKAYLSREKIKNPLLVVTKNNCKQVAQLFGYEHTVVVAEEEMKNLLLAWQFLGSEKMSVKPLLFWGWGTKYYYRNYRIKKDLSFIDLFRYDVYGLDNDVSFEPPQLEKNEIYLSELFSKNKLIKGRTIIIAPFAGSFVSSISEETWKAVVKDLAGKGYVLCTNCYGEEKPLPGTIPIQFPYSKVVNVLEYAGGFIGVRSGLCDIASSAKCKMVVIYENNYLASDYEFFSIKKMGLNNEVIEINYEKANVFLDEINCFFE